jgi:thiamine pyrophosphate-dependent acetolactate synthase large subunit-like protein
MVLNKYVRPPSKYAIPTSNQCLFSTIGYPGGAILPVFDVIYGCEEFNFVLPRHEQGAGHMTEEYARASGKPGVVLVTSGPGATNLITPMADALADGTPLVVFCGQVATSSIGLDGFQEAVFLECQCHVQNRMWQSGTSPNYLDASIKHLRSQQVVALDQFWLSCQ